MTLPLLNPQKSLVKMAAYKESDSPKPSVPSRRHDRLTSITGRRPILSDSHPQK